MTVVKICGITDVFSGLAAIDAGAEYLGFVFYPPSIRALTAGPAAQLITELRAARGSGWQAVGVFVNKPLAYVADVLHECRLDVVQLNGEETAEYIRQVPVPVFRAVRFSADGPVPLPWEIGAERVLVDANVPGRYGGTGVSYDWSAVKAAVAHGFLAGGLTPENVGEALRAARPWGVDVSSGVEVQGVKSIELIARFIERVREADRRLAAPAAPREAADRITVRGE